MLLFKPDMNITSKQTDMTVLSQTSTRNGYSIVFVHSLNRMSILLPMNTWNVHLTVMTLITMIESYQQFGVVVLTSSVTANSVINLKNLIENCNLTNDDLALILQTLELK